MDLSTAYIKAIIISVILILSYFFNQISKKFRIPNVILLIGLGIGIQEFLKGSDLNIRSYLNATLELLGIVGLIMIILEATLDLKLKREKRSTLIRTLGFSMFYILFATCGTAYLLHKFLVEDFLHAVTYAIPITVLSSAIIIQGIENLAPSKREFLLHESIFSDIIGIMIFYLLIESVSVHAWQVSGNIPVNISITLVVSFMISYVLVFLLQYFDTKVKLFFLISILVLLYSLGKILHLSSLLIILVFGLILNNHRLFFRGKLKNWINDETISHILEDFHIVTLESSFVVRTFFFILFGMSLELSEFTRLSSILLALGILLLSYLIRYVLLRIMVGKNIFPQVWISPRGLVTVLLFFSIPAGLQDPGFSPAILMIIILVSGLVMSAALNTGKEDIEETSELKFDDWEELDRELEQLNAEGEAGEKS